MAMGLNPMLDLRQQQPLFVHARLGWVLGSRLFSSRRRTLCCSSERIGVYDFALLLQRAVVLLI